MRVPQCSLALRPQSVPALAALVTAVAFSGVLASPALASHDPDCNADDPANPPGSATIWSHPQCLTPLGDNGEVPQVEISDEGTAVAVWRIRDSRSPEKFRVQYSIRERGVNGGNFVVQPDPPAPGAPQSEVDAYNAALDATFLSAEDVDVGVHLRMDMNRRGDVIVVWEQEAADGDINLWCAFKPFDGDFGAPQVVMDDEGTHDDWVNPEVGIDGDGQATVIFQDPPLPTGTAPSGSQQSWFFSKTRSAGVGGTWQGTPDVITPHEVYPGENPPDPQYNEYSAKLKVEESGTRRALLVSEKWGGTIADLDGRPGDGRPRIIAAEMGPSATMWTGDGQYDEGADVPHSLFLFKFAGNTMDVFSQNGHLFGTSPIGGSLEQVDRQLDPNTAASGSTVALDNNLDAIALWSTGTLLHANYNGFDESGGWRATADSGPIPGNGTGERTRPALAAPYNGDSAVALFQEKVLDDESVWAAVRPPGEQFDRGFDAPVQLSKENDLENEGVDPDGPFTAKRGTGPKIAANGDGEAVAAWSIGDGQTNKVVQVSILVPRPDPDDPDPPPVEPPAPPPPRPKPAVSSPIQLARPDARDQALVLIANIPGDIRELRWKFGSVNEPPSMAGKVEGGELQRTIRLRLPNNEFRAQVEAVTADGSLQKYSRTFSPLRPSSSANTRAVVTGLEGAKSPPVFAVGDKETLTGESSSCSATSIWSGEQKQSGCFKPIEKIVDIPALERGALKEVGDALHIDETKKDLMEKATQLTDGYVAQGRALINDKFPVIPEQGAQIVSMYKAKTLVSANAQLPVGSATYDPKNGFNLKLDPNKAKIPLGKLPRPPKLPSLGGLEIVGDFDVDLEKQEAKIRASLVLPKEITKAGLRLENEIILRATPERIIVDEARVGPIDADIGALQVRSFKIEYKREGDEWLGQAKATVLGAGIDVAPPNGSVRIKGGKLVFLGATIRFPAPGIPIFKGVFMERIGFGLGLDPTRMTGSVGIGVLTIVSVDGRLVLAFPSSRTPYILRRDEIGHEFPTSLEGKTFTRTTIGAAGSVSIQLPALGAVKLASGYVLYEFPGYIALGGGFDFNLLDVATLSGGISGEMDIDKEAFNVHGSIRACIADVACGSAVGNISRGRGNIGGAGACIGLLGVNIGGGVQWNRLDEPFIWPFDGCKWSRFKIDVRAAARAAQVGGAHTVDVRAGEPSPAIKLYGQGGPPRVSVQGPGGQSLTADAQGLDMSPGGKIRVLSFKGNKFSGPFTVVGLQNADPGRYTITPVPGSPPISRVARTTDQPDAQVSAKVTGKGRRRVLTYNVRSREEQKVIFQEVAPGGASRVIGTVNGGGRGRLRFSSSPGGGRRKVYAQFELAGVPAERKFLTSFRPLSIKLATPRRLKVRHVGNSLRARWRRVSGATRYEIGVRLTGRRMTFKTVRRNRARLKVAGWQAGRLFVRAVDVDRQSRSASRRFGGKGRRPSPFRPLLNCRIRGARIICAGVRSRCDGRVPTISASAGRRTLGTKRSDVIVGSSGNDIIDGRGGNDVICAGEGNDVVSGGRGDDRILGGSGRDRLHGRGGDDRIAASSGGDLVSGGTGDDRILGGAGRDRLGGGAGDDRLTGGPGADRIFGGKGFDRISAGSGADFVSGGTGNDRILAGSGRDRISCGPGRDRARVGAGDSKDSCDRLRRG